MGARFAFGNDQARGSEYLECSADYKVDRIGLCPFFEEELTVSHDLEVERLQERLGQLQTVQDKLELSLGGIFALDYFLNLCLADDPVAHCFTLMYLIDACTVLPIIFSFIFSGALAVTTAG